MATKHQDDQGSQHHPTEPEVDEVLGPRTSWTMRWGNVVPSLRSIRRAKSSRKWLVALLLLLPLVATLATWSGIAGESRTEVLAVNAGSQGPVLGVEATALAVDPNLGEMAVRLVLTPSADLLEGDRLAEDMTFVVNDESDRDVRTLTAGSVVEPTTVVVGLEGNSSRYPFDSYSGLLNIGATSDGVDGDGSLPVELTFAAALEQFRIDAVPDAGSNTAAIAIDLQRRWTSIVWVIFFMAICWAIALCCIAVAWWTAVYDIEVPFWTYALFAAVLFALPSLRSGLPGAPAYGVLVDWAAFYWSIALVAISLVTALLLWITSTRREFRTALGRIEDVENSPVRDFPAGDSPAGDSPAGRAPDGDRPLGGDRTRDPAS